MPVLHVELGYTRGNPQKYQWLRTALPTALRQLHLDTVVIVTLVPIIPPVDPPFFDSDLFELTKKVIERSPVRRSAEASDEWYVHLLITSFHQNNFLGVMYDFSFDSRQRQGCAIFENEILGVAGGDLMDARQVLLRTALHEIGHCLNLIHRDDLTIMAQTSTLMRTPDWIRRIHFDYALPDIRFVDQQPRESRPGGFTSRMGRAEDAALPKNADQLAISFRDFNVPGKFKFRCGEPVSLIVKLNNKTKHDVALASPLHLSSENVRVWIKYPDGKIIRLRKSIKGCGSLQKKHLIRKGDHGLLPIHLYADHAGYIFDTVGKYKIKLAVKSGDGHWFVSGFHAVTITKGSRSSAGVSPHQSLAVTQFIALGGSSKPKVRNHSLSLAEETDHGLGRALYWNLSYQLKNEIFSIDTTSSVQRKKAEKLLLLYRSLLRLEKSPIRKGKVILNSIRIRSLLQGRPSKITTNQLKDIKAYETFSKKLIKIKDYEK